jgi:hypothetical protein
MNYVSQAMLKCKGKNYSIKITDEKDMMQIPSAELIRGSIPYHYTH